MIKTILFQGDSITDAGRSRDDNANLCDRLGRGYVPHVAGALAAARPERQLEFINRGISGDRVTDLYARWKIDAINLRPDLLSILIGVNDTWHEKMRANGVEVPRYARIYRELLEWTRRELPTVKLVLMEPFILDSEITSGWLPEIRERAEIVAKLAADFDAVFVPLQEMLDAAAARCGAVEPVLTDGVHPNLLGAKLIADRWVECCQPLFREQC